MTYYEELGIPTNASDDEIRHAYKRLARLIHPDHCADESKRRLAELQMRRLDFMLETLLDPSRRLSYDRSLAALAAAVSGESPPEQAGRLPAPFPGAAPVTISVALLVSVLALWPSRQPSAMPFLPQLAGAIQGQTATQKSDRRPVRWQIHKPQLLEDMEWEPLATHSYESHIAIPPPPLFDPLPRKAAVAPAENLRSTLAGEWMYVPSSPADRPGFRPEYIELGLRQTGDNLHGSYRAGYLVTHQAVSQDVTFQLDGRAGPQGGVFPWHGPSGARGEVTLQLQADGNLKVTWKAGRSGSEIGLISGTATLVRKSEQP